MKGEGRQGVEQNLAAVGAIVGRKTAKYNISEFTQMALSEPGSRTPRNRGFLWAGEAH